jgi:hypothetical protein
MRTVDNLNIMKSNAYAKVNKQELAAAGETISGLLVNLFSCYREARDKQ